MDLIIRKLNEAYIKIQCEKSIGQELCDYFTFYVPGAHFSPKFKNKLWDGRIRLYNTQTNTLYHGLISYVEKFCKDRGYTYQMDSAVNITEEFSVVEAERFVKALKLPEKITERDYQIDAFVKGVRNRRMLFGITYCVREVPFFVHEPKIFAV